MSLDSLSETNLIQLTRHCEEAILRRQKSMEQALAKRDVPGAYVVTGNIEELRHLIAAVASELRGRTTSREA